MAEIEVKEVNAVADPVALAAIKRTVQKFPKAEHASSPIDSLVIYFSSIADTIPQWDTSVVERDKRLRQLFNKGVLACRRHIQHRRQPLGLPLGDPD
ncbi:unnamed protein product [marine sediment metagenome]|uniref:Uncharacterized protein n=1 Tax=marine sediment metagenome TaxID=412755 RepID=X1CY28_9ZZZZ